MQSKITKLKYVAELILGGTPSTDDNKNWVGGNIPWIDSGKVNLREIYLKDVNKFITNEAIKKSSTQLVRCTSPLLAITGATCSKVAFLHFDCYINQSIIGFDTLDKINPRYIFYVLISLKDEIISLKSGGAQGGVTKKDIENLSFNYVNLEYQNLISKYLDNQSQIIDSLIEKIEKKIELINEQKTALINQYITKGLDPNVEMKDSGVEWIGDIPKHWEVKPLKYIAEITLGKMLTPNKKEDMLYRPYLRSLNVQENHLNLEDISYMWFSRKEIEKFVLKQKDILVNEGGEVGRPCILKNDINETGFQNSINRIRVQNGNPDYIYLVIYLCFKRRYYDSIVNRVSIPHLTKEKLENCLVLIPPLEEQSKIERELNLKFEKISEIMKLEKKRILFLKDYRQSLISSVVTGKIRITEDMI